MSADRPAVTVPDEARTAAEAAFRGAERELAVPGMPSEGPRLQSTWDVVDVVLEAAAPLIVAAELERLDKSWPYSSDIPAYALTRRAAELRGDS